MEKITRRAAAKELWAEAKQIPIDISETYHQKLRDSKSFTKALKKSSIEAIGTVFFCIIIFVLVMIDPELGD